MAKGIIFKMRHNTIKFRVRILYIKFPWLKDNDTELVETYTQKFCIKLTEAQRSSVRRSGRHWREEWGYERKTAATEQQLYIEAFPRSKEVSKLLV